MSEPNLSSRPEHVNKWRNGTIHRNTTAESSSLNSLEENIQGIESLLYSFIPLLEEQRKMLLNINISFNIDTWLATTRKHTLLRPDAGNDTYIRDVHKFKIPIINLTIPKEELKKYMVQKYYNLSFDDHHGLDYDFRYINKTGLNFNDFVKALDSPLPFNYKMNSKYTFKSMDNDSHSTMGFIHLLSGAIVMPQGEVFYKDLKLHPGGCPYDLAPMLSRRSAHQLKFADEVFTMAERHGHEVFHMMIEDLPRIIPYLQFLWQHKQIKIHVAAQSSLTIEMLGLLGIEKQRLINGYVRAKIVYLPMGISCGTANMFNIQLLSMYCRRSISQANKDAHRSRSLLLIKRSRKKRFFTHHDQILQQLQLMGMRSNITTEVFADTPVPPFQRFSKMFYSASMVVGPHGAGMSNIIFAKPGTLIVEAICMKSILNHSFAILAFVLGHIYYGIMPTINCTTVTATHVMPPVEHYLMWLKNKTPTEE